MSDQPYTVGFLLLLFFSLLSFDVNSAILNNGSIGKNISKTNYVKTYLDVYSSSYTCVIYKEATLTYIKSVCQLLSRYACQSSLFSLICIYLSITCGWARQLSISLSTIINACVHLGMVDIDKDTDRNRLNMYFSKISQALFYVFHIYHFISNNIQCASLIWEYILIWDNHYLTEKFIQFLQNLVYVIIYIFKPNLFNKNRHFF